MGIGAMLHDIGKIQLPDGIAGENPNGTHVKLSTGEAGIDKEQNKDYPTRPMVRVLRDKDGKNYNDPRIEDLMKNHSIVIAE